MVFFCNFVSASYITGDIFIYPDGKTRFSINSDVNPNIKDLIFIPENNRLTGETYILTSKSREMWAFFLNISNYDTILVDIHLPDNLYSIESIQGVDNTINMDDRVISLIDSGKLQFSVEYKLKSSDDHSWIAYLVILLLIMLVVYLVYIILKRKSKKARLDYILPIINDNEKRIIEQLMKKSLRQKKLRKKLSIPKSSFSRYMLNLEKKNLIIREGEGKNKIVKLK
jgi:uncharacterized membrane protein